MAAVIKGILELLFGLLLSLVLPDQHHCIHNFGWAISPSAGSAEPLQGQHTCLHFGERTSKERVRAFSPGKPWILGGPCHGCPMPWMPWHGQGVGILGTFQTLKNWRTHTQSPGRAEPAEDAWAHGLRLTYTLAKPGVQTHGLARRKLVSHRLGQKVSNGAKTGPLLCRLVGLENAKNPMVSGDYHQFTIASSNHPSLIPASLASDHPASLQACKPVLLHLATSLAHSASPSASKAAPSSKLVATAPCSSIHARKTIKQFPQQQ